jgi:hydrogenase-4 membrane subunit HyfE
MKVKLLKTQESRICFIICVAFLLTAIPDAVEIGLFGGIIFMIMMAAFLSSFLYAMFKFVFPWISKGE